VAHQFLALAEITAEELTRLGYKGKHSERAKRKYLKQIQKAGLEPDQGAIRLFASKVDEALKLYGGTR
jgi:hypothetical protein